MLRRVSRGRGGVTAFFSGGVCVGDSNCTNSFRCFVDEGRNNRGGGGGRGRGGGGRGEGGSRGGWGRSRGRAPYKDFGNVAGKRPLRDAHLDGMSENRFNPNRRLTVSPQDEVNLMNANEGLKRANLLVGGLRDKRLSDTLKSTRQLKKELAEGVLTTKHDPDGIYKPSHRPTRLTMPIDFDDAASPLRSKMNRDAHEVFHKDYAERVAALGGSTGPSAAVGRDGGGLAAATLREARDRTMRAPADAKSYESSHAPPDDGGNASPASGFATTSASYTSSGIFDTKANKEHSHTDKARGLEVPKGALAAGEVPSERSMADCFRFLLDNCKMLGILSSSSASSGGVYGGGNSITMDSNRPIKAQLDALAKRSTAGDDSFSSVFDKLHKGGAPVFDPVALPMCVLMRALKEYQTVLNEMEKSIVASSTSSSSIPDVPFPPAFAIFKSKLPTSPSSPTSIATIGNASSRCSILPAPEMVCGSAKGGKKRLSRTEALKLLATTNKNIANVDGEAAHNSTNVSTADNVLLNSDPSSNLDPSSLCSFSSYLTHFQKEQHIYRQWDLMEAMPLNSPNNGATSHCGKQFATHYTAHELIHSAFPNCRSRLLQSLLHKYLTSPLAVINACNEIGLTSFTNYETEVGLYRESVTLYSTWVHVKGRLAQFHAERFLRKNIETNDYGRLQSVMKSLKIRMSALPSDPDTLHLRYKWLEDLFFSFIEFVRRGEGEDAAKRIIDHYFAPTLARHKYRRAALEEAFSTMEAVGDQLTRMLRSLNQSSSSNSNSDASFSPPSSSPPHSSFFHHHAALLKDSLQGTADVLNMLRDIVVDVILVGDGCDGYGSIRASDGIQTQQMLMKRHLAACEAVVSQLAVAHQGIVAAMKTNTPSRSPREEQGESEGSERSAPATEVVAAALPLLPPPFASIYPILSEELSLLKRLISTDMRISSDGWGASGPTSSASSAPSMATRALDAILRYHPLKNEAHVQSLLRSTSSGAIAVNPFMNEGGGSGLLLDSQGSDDEVASVAMQLALEDLKEGPCCDVNATLRPVRSEDENGGDAMTGAASPSTIVRSQVARLRSFMAVAFLPPSTLLATANSSITRPLQELQILLKYSPHVWEGLAEGGGNTKGEGGGGAVNRRVDEEVKVSVEADEEERHVNAPASASSPPAPGARSYALHFDVRKQTGLFEADEAAVGGGKGLEGLVNRKQQQYFVATLYLYHYADIVEDSGDEATTKSSAPLFTNGNTADTETQQQQQKRRRIVKRHVLGTGLGINIDSSTHAAAMRVLKRFYYKGGSSSQWALGESV